MRSQERKKTSLKKFVYSLDFRIQTNEALAQQEKNDVTKIRANML